MMLSRSVWLFLLVLSVPQMVEGRKWEDAISVAIYAQSHVDIPRIQFSLEEDPFNNIMVAPTALAESSYPPSDAPSSVPSFFDDSIMAVSDGDEETKNGSVSPIIECPPSEIPYEVNKYDTWGDGWGDASITIRQVGGSSDSNGNSERTLRELDYVLVGGLRSGNFDSQYVCLAQTACYRVIVKGGKWQEETKWEIVPAVQDEVDSDAPILNIVANGQGFSNCTFYTAENSTDIPNCSFTCGPKYQDDANENFSSNFSIASDAYSSPTLSPVFAPTMAPTFEALATGAPTMPTGIPSDVPSLVPTV